MLRIAVQRKGRLNEQSMDLLREAGVLVGDERRKFIVRAEGFPVEILFLRDDDIPQTVSMGVADLGIVGYNEVAEHGHDVSILHRLGFGDCRISLAVPKSENYTGLSYFEGKCIATSYPNILQRFFSEHGIAAAIHTITGSVEIAPAAGIADAIFDIVSTGGSLITNGLVEVERVLESEAVLIGCPGLSDEKMELARRLMSRFDAVLMARGKKYLVFNLPVTALDEVLRMLPAMRSPTVIPLAQKDWCSLQTVVDERELWNIVEQLKQVGAEGILVQSLEKIIL